MCIWEEGGEPRDGYVLGEQVELGYALDERDLTEVFFLDGVDSIYHTRRQLRVQTVGSRH